LAQLQALAKKVTLPVLDLSGTAADLQTHYDALAGIGVYGTFVTVTDSNFPTVSVSAADYAKNMTLNFGLSGDFVLAVDASQSSGVNINGAQQVATVVVYSGPSANYSLSTWAETALQISDTGVGHGRDLLFGVTAVQFADGIDFVVQAPSSTGTTSGNVAELYAAVLARTPDVPGLSYYEREIQGGHPPSILQLAENFLASPEYANNPAHAYQQNAAGDAQFITDTYQNLLHRAPESGAVPYYQALIAQYTAGSALGHAQMLVDFSASAEFLNDVQITSQHPADAQHWLYVT